MPSTQTLPSIADLLKAGRNAVRAQKDRYADVRVGSLHDHYLGPTAVLFSRETQNDRDLFGDIYLQNAEGSALTNLVQARWPALSPRVLSTAGTGGLVVQRPNVSLGGGTFWQGTRIQVAGTPPAVYQVSADTPVPAAALLAIVPVQAAVFGSGSAINTQAGLSLQDPLWDNTWVPIQLACSDGTDFEQADAYRARALSVGLAQRNGYLTEMVNVCKAQGAAYIVGFTSQYGLTNDDTGFANDFGLNALYVADANFQSTATLIQNCAIALESARVLGADLWVGGMTQSTLYLNVLISLVKDPGKLEIVPIQRAVLQAVLAYFSATQSGYTFKLDGIAGAVVKAHPDIQKVVQFNSPTKDVLLSSARLPASLTRYVLLPRYVTSSFVGPS